MIAILGSGFFAQAFARELARRKLDFKLFSRVRYDYARVEALVQLLKTYDVHFLVNAAGLCGVPNVDAVERAKGEAILANVLLPSTVAVACAYRHVPWLHLSSGCVFDGLSPSKGGWLESDAPNFGFGPVRHSFYAATKELAERVIASVGGNCYICRLRMPFSEFDSAKNLLTKLQYYPRVYYSPKNSLSHLGDCVRACVDLWDTGAKPGIYHVCNPGAVTNREIVEMIRRALKPNRPFLFYDSDAEFYQQAASAPRSNCVLSVEKLRQAGIELRPVTDALTWSLENWQSQSGAEV